MNDSGILWPPNKMIGWGIWTFRWSMYKGNFGLTTSKVGKIEFN